MEKIYMNEYNNQNKRKMDFSVLLLFIVAIFAVFSLATYGILSNQNSSISYAASVGETFSFHVSDISTFVVYGSNQFNVNPYYADTAETIPVYCVERGNDSISDGATYTRGDAIEDYGLIYILNNLVNIDGDPYLTAFVNQSAISLYLHETNPTGNNGNNRLSDADVSTIKNATEFKVMNLNNPTVYIEEKTISGGVYNTYIKSLVEGAQGASSLRRLSVTKGNEKVVKTSDEKYYRSPRITVVGTPSNTLQSYDISVSGFDGVKIQDESGNEISPTDVRIGSFYILVPVDKVTNEVKKAVISVTGKFNTIGGYYYLSGGHQKVVTTYAGEIDVSDGTEVEFVGSPDTGMNTTQTIYFIGLIVLLCGVGIVYANAKPVESKQ